MVSGKSNKLYLLIALVAAIFFISAAVTLVYYMVAVLGKSPLAPLISSIVSWIAGALSLVYLLLRYRVNHRDQLSKSKSDPNKGKGES